MACAQPTSITPQSAHTTKLFHAWQNVLLPVFSTLMSRCLVLPSLWMHGADVQLRCHPIQTTKHLQLVRKHGGYISCLTAATAVLATALSAAELRPWRFLCIPRRTAVVMGAFLRQWGCWGRRWGQHLPFLLFHACCFPLTTHAVRCSTDPQGDHSHDERLWAALELYAATGEVCCCWFLLSATMSELAWALAGQVAPLLLCMLF